MGVVRSFANGSVYGDVLMAERMTVPPFGQTCRPSPDNSMPSLGDTHICQHLNEYTK